MAKELFKELLKNTKEAKELWEELNKIFGPKPKGYTYGWLNPRECPTKKENEFVWTDPLLPYESSIPKPEPSTCLWDSFTEEEKARPIGLSCPCPKCTPYC